MIKLLRQSTAQTIMFGPFLDATDGVTAETALTIAQADRQLSKDGGAYAQSSETGNSTHDADGWYADDLTTADTDTLGILMFQVTVAGACPVWHEFMVVPAVVYDCLVLGTDDLNAQVAGIDAAARAEVNAEVLDVLNTDAFGEPGQGAPPVSTNLVAKIGYLYKFMRNRVTSTNTTISVYNDDETTVDHKATHSDDTTTYDREEYVSGP